ncbi:hypothetical protein GCM10022393_36740 [Aquimarina addita]|uniref:Methyltransferase type 11 domain-containing protein n=1 Tax=Aquimarina addita TaxID=870485 RepID=A0ABP6USX1_9FLAO
MPEKYDTIGRGYNTTRKADPYLFSQLYALLNPSKNGTYVDIGCGTGNYTKQFAKKGYSFIGIDPSKKMLQRAAFDKNSVQWKIGNAENLNLPSGSIDGIIASLTLNHWSNLNTSFASLSRILKQEARIIIFTATPEQMKGYWLNHYFPKMLEDSIQQMPSLSIINKHLSTNGLMIEQTKKYEIKSDLKDLFLYAGKNNPVLYLKSKVRQGISSFSSLANAPEVEKGLKTLKADINSGKINRIIKSYEHTRGYYLFLIIKKVIL